MTPSIAHDWLLERASDLNTKHRKEEKQILFLLRTKMTDLVDHVNGNSESSNDSLNGYL